MPRPKSRFICSQCGYESPRWLGRCPECESWNSLEEAAPAVETGAAEKKLKRRPGAGGEIMRIDDVPESDLMRFTTGVEELDRVLGGGAVEGSLVLVGGDPGIGKSTLLTQLSVNVAHAGKNVLYVAGEESARQVKMRARRIAGESNGFYILPETDMQAVMRHVEKNRFDCLIVDSIQTMYRPDMASAPGSVSQVRECASEWMRYAKETGAAVFLVGHVTKEGAIAGPRVLEHLVDAVLYFEGDRQHQYRLLRAAKNRFGSVNELGMFEMTDRGMRGVPGASEALLSERAHGQSGSAVLCALEGSRAVLTDVQALVSGTIIGNPRRMANGVDPGRLFMLLAVLEKRAGVQLYNQDVYVNIAGGLEIDEPAADLAVMAAVASSARNRVIDAATAVMGEVGLAGEVRAIPQAERRLVECARMGFTKAILPKGNLRSLRVPEGINARGVETAAEALSVMLNGR
ncbi:MAG: DNA repair protein RadA [Clostridia bacterium]|nr:DNA repair protein RadA [Clostridia bacterium]